MKATAPTSFVCGQTRRPRYPRPFLAGQLQARWYVSLVTTNADLNFLQLQILDWGNFNGDKTGLNPDQDYALEMNWSWMPARAPVGWELHPWRSA